MRLTGVRASHWTASPSPSRATEFEPKDREARREKGVALFELSRFDQARAETALEDKALRAVRDPGVFDRVLDVAMSNPPYATPGPSRAELEDLLG